MPTPQDLGIWDHDLLAETRRHEIAEIKAAPARLAASKAHLRAITVAMGSRPDGMDCASNTERILSLAMPGRAPVTKRAGGGTATGLQTARPKRAFCSATSPHLPFGQGLGRAPNFSALDPQVRFNVSVSCHSRESSPTRDRRFQIQDFLAVPIFNSRLFVNDYFARTCRKRRVYTTGKHIPSAVRRSDLATRSRLRRLSGCVTVSVIYRSNTNGLRYRC